MMAQEGHLAANALLSGFERIATIDYHSPGSIYSALFDISIGLERLMKCTFIVQYAANNSLHFPSDKDLRKFSHSLTKIYDELREIAQEVGFDTGWFEPASIHYDLLENLSVFAISSRYHNIDQVTGEQNRQDPLVSWFKLHMEVAHENLSTKKLIAINDRAIAYCDQNNLYGYAMGFRGNYELTVDIISQEGVLAESRGHLVWHIIELIKPICRLLEYSCSKSHTMEIENNIESSIIPHLDEFFPFRFTTKKDAMRRKIWSKLFKMAGRY